MAQLTKMQQKIYDYIAQAIQDQGYPPSVREIGEAVGLKSPSTVHFHLKHLEELGVIGKQAGRARRLKASCLKASRPKIRCPLWAMWPPDRPSWPRNASRIT